MRVKFLFWNYNIAKGSLMAKMPAKGDPLAWMVKDQGVDVLILADCTLSTEDILSSLASFGLEFSITVFEDDKVRVFSRFGPDDLVPVLSDDRMVFFRLMPGGDEEVLIGATHLYDRKNFPLPHSRHAKIERHYQTLVEAEKVVGHRRTILLGDFNMTPDEMGMVDPTHAFGALMTWDLAEIHSAVENEESPRFYNPMWSLMGRAEAPGTYYWESTDPYNIFWYCLDGVIVRPALRGIFRDETLAILTVVKDPEGREIPLFRFAKKHWKFELSDHLPVTFELDLREKNPGATHG